MTWLDQLLKEQGQGFAPVSSLDPTLERLCSGLPVEDIRDLREERAAILEYEAGFSRAKAEAKALEEIMPLLKR